MFKQAKHKQVNMQSNLQKQIQTLFKLISKTKKGNSNDLYTWANMFTKYWDKIPMGRSKLKSIK